MPRPLAVSDLLLDGPGTGTNLAGGDWLTVSGVDSLLQAIWLRLSTVEGALRELGHPDYGSRLYLLIGQRDTPDTRDRARLYVLRALAREPRVAEVLAVRVSGSPAGSGRQLEVSVRVRPVGASSPLDFGFPVFLETDS